MALLEKILWQVDSHLADALSLTQIAQRSAISQHYMCRVFQQGTGMSIMAYVRARRLSVAALELAGCDKDILSVALDAGYGSHEAFTRAFVSYFGVLPRAVRKAKSLETLELMEPFTVKQDMLVEVGAAEMRDREAFRVVGLSTECRYDDVSGITPLWQKFLTRSDEIDAAIPSTAFGVSYSAQSKGSFLYLAGMAALSAPPGMEVVEVPKNRYAVFTHRGHVSDLPKTVYTIWNKTLSDAGLDPANAPDFELYDQRFNPDTGFGVAEIWIPVT